MNKHKKTILIIDDDEVFCRTLCRSVQRRGYNAIAAHNSEQALALVQQGKPEFVVLDLRLGNDSGLQLIQPLINAQPKLRIVVLTGFASLATAVQAVKLGAFNYLAKPVDSDTILRALVGDQQNSPIEQLTPTPLKQLEWEHIHRVLDENEGNISATARNLGMHRRTLQRKLQKRLGSPIIQSIETSA